MATEGFVPATSLPLSPPPLLLGGDMPSSPSLTRPSSVSSLEPLEEVRVCEERKATCCKCQGHSLRSARRYQCLNVTNTPSFATRFARCRLVSQISRICSRLRSPPGLQGFLPSFPLCRGTTTTPTKYRRKGLVFSPTSCPTPEWRLTSTPGQCRLFLSSQTPVRVSPISPPCWARRDGTWWRCF